MKNQTFTHWLRTNSKWILDPGADLFFHIGLLPNHLSLLVLFSSLVSAYLCSIGEFFFAGLTVLLFQPLDAFDGALARRHGITSRFGALLDSTFDRASEYIIFSSLIFFAFFHSNIIICTLALYSVLVSFLVSYVRARASGLGFEVNIGLMGRVERYFVLAIFLMFGLPLPMLLVTSIGGTYTLFQRIREVALLEKKSNNQD